MKKFVVAAFAAALLVASPVSAFDSSHLSDGDRVAIGDWMPKQMTQAELDALWVDPAAEVPADAPSAKREDGEQSSLSRFEFCGTVCRAALVTEVPAAERREFAPASAL